MLAKRIDLLVAAGVALAYFACVYFFLPPNTRIWSFARGAVVFSAVIAAARILGPATRPAVIFLVVAFVAIAVLLMPTFPAMGGAGSVSSAIALLGVQAATILWAALTWRAPASVPPMPLRTALRYGLGAAVGLSIIATIPILIILFKERFTSAEILLAYPAYFVGLSSAAIVYWFLQSVQHLATGRYLIGVLGGFCVYIAAAPIVYPGQE